MKKDNKALITHPGSMLEHKEKRRKELALKRQQKFELTQTNRLANRLPSLYQEKEDEVRKKYKIDRNYDKNIAYAVIVAVVLGVIGVSHEEVRALSFLIMFGCLIAGLLVIVKKVLGKEENEQKNLLIRNEINHNFEKELIHIKQHFESLGFEYPKISTQNQALLDAEKMKLLKYNG